ncbi:MAG: hypothetical protein JXA89_25690 [Anaerolineae bacterium]|nr:hypothetical protein [Anaerolineae bacterium]
MSSELGNDRQKRQDPIEWAKDRLTRRSLIAFDLDKTVLEQGEQDELQQFTWSICQTLIHLAEQGFHISAVTGNSLSRLSAKFVNALVRELCRYRRLSLLSQFHLFCNGASVYIHFPPGQLGKLLCFEASLAQDKDLDPFEADKRLTEKALSCLFADSRQASVKDEFIDVEYLSKTAIKKETVDAIIKIAQGVVSTWWAKLDLDQMRSSYYINYPGGRHTDQNRKVYADCEGSENKEASVFHAFSEQGELPPQVIKRTVTDAQGTEHCPQIAVKDILSYRHARTRMNPNEDPRAYVVQQIRQGIEKEGLTLIAVIPGGRGTIDITKQDSNKKQALLYLIERLEIKGDSTKREGEGINVLYFGDEVVLSGNDIEVTRIPDIQVFAVNPHRERVPMSSRIWIPRTHLIGPKATDFVLRKLETATSDLLSTYANDVLDDRDSPRYGHKTAVHIFREMIEREIIQEKMERGSWLWTSGKTDLHVLNAVSTLLTVLTRPGEGATRMADKVNRMINEWGMEAQEYKESLIPDRSYLALGGSHWDTEGDL